MTAHRHDTEKLRCGEAVAEISTAGAELIRWRVGHTDLLWKSDPAFWARTSPILFPIVGRARDGALSVANRRYPMNAHGFAAGCKFRVISRARHEVRMRLVDNAFTQKTYPFPFTLDVGYRIAAVDLTVEFRIANPGPRVLPYSLGFHPGFAWPFSATQRAGHSVLFERPEDALVPIVTADGLFSGETRPSGLQGSRLDLTDSALSNEALCFLNARSRFARFVSPDGGGIVVEARNFDHFAIWSRPPAPFLAIEAWTGHADAADFVGDMSERRSTRLLAPGADAERFSRARKAYPGGRSPWRRPPARNRKAGQI